MPNKDLNLRRLRPAPSLKDMALATIKEAILSKTLDQEVMYTEAALTNELGISRTPVREALIHLATRGLITYFPRKGFKINVLTERDIVNLFELRLALELTVIRHITPGLTAKSLIEIDRVWTEYLKRTQSGDPVKSVHANMTFHACLTTLTENTYLIDALNEIGDRISLAGVRSLEVNSRTPEAVKEHEKIIVELKRQSLNGALREMEKHIRTTEERVLARIRNS